MTAFTVASRNRVERIFSRANAASDLPGAARLRRGLAVLFALYAAILMVSSVASGELPKGGYALILMGAGALWFNRGGAFVRDWLPVMLGIYAYAIAASFAQKLDLSVHYLPQMDFDQFLFFGQVPTVELQNWLYDGTTGPLEVFATLAYISHFFGPAFLGFYVWWRGRRDAFVALMFGILGVSIMGEITFVLFPTAPPWMAAQDGYIPEVHHLLKSTLYDLHLTRAADFVGNADNYNTVAAMPSLHAAWPVVSLLLTLRYGLPRWTTALAALQFACVLFAIVYTGDHYVSDAIVGVAYALVATALVERALGRRRERKAARAGSLRTALADERGQALLEYALITFFVSIAGVATLTLIGSDLGTMITSVANAF
jgi:Flp pilus assembly pilin Flp